MDTLTLAIVGHLVGDYLLQNDWMALNKKKPTATGELACCIHCAIWTISVTAFAGWATPLICGFLWLAHYAQDRTNVVLWWMTKVNRQPQFASGPCAPWSIIVVDNVWHIVSLYIVARFVG